MEATAIQKNIEEIAHQFSNQRKERQLRRALVQADFDLLREAGFLLTGALLEHGGIWESVARSTRPVSEILRALAHGDSSVALVASMHPAVLIFWLATAEAPEPYCQAWKEQRNQLSQSAVAGAWWATIASEPGSGGDISKSKATARFDPATNKYLISGNKHFGSGSGIADYMLTSALPEGEDRADWFYFDMRGVGWHGSQRVKLVAAWDGQGMTATQSHAMAFENFPATRIAWPGNINKTVAATNSAALAFFGGVILGIVETAIATARQQLERKRDSLSAFEQVEWVKAQEEAWLVEQAYEGMLRAIETQPAPTRQMMLGKNTIANLAESATGRLCRLIGGSTFSRNSPFGFWFEDVRAMGFLRPPWAMSYEGLFKLSWG